MTDRVVYGTGPVTELIERRARTIELVYIDHRRHKRKRDAVHAIVATARARGVSVAFAHRQHLDALAGGAHHQGVVAIAGEYSYADIDHVLARVSAAGEPALMLALDGVQDPRNLGAIIRSAHVLGAHAVIIPRDRAAGVTNVVTKTSAGATEHIPICQVGNLARSLTDLKQAGLWLAALAPGPGARPLSSIEPDLPLCLVLGAEGAGIRRITARACDFHLEIPMAPGAGVGSLNVAVAAGIAVYELTRQRRARPSDDPI